MNNEARVISALLKRKDFMDIMNNSPANLFKSHKDIWDFVYDYYRRYREVPSIQAVNEEFSDFEYVDVPDVTGHYVDILRKERMREELEAMIAGAAKSLKDAPQDVEKIAKRFERRTIEIQRSSGESRSLDVKDVDAALEHMEKVRQYRELHDGEPGIMTGFKEMDANYPTGLAPGHFVVVMGYSGLGKDNAVDSVVYDKNGPKRFGDLKVGDKVIGRNGQETDVVGIYPQGVKDAYRVTMTDGTSVIAGSEHLWSIQTHKMRQKYYDDRFRTVTTKEIIEKYLPREQGEMNENGRRSKTYHAYLPTIKPVEFEEKDLPVDPYTLGVFLANGVMGEGVSFSTNDQQIADRVALKHHIVKHHRSESSTRQGYGIGSIKSELINLGFSSDTRSANKFIPREYLYGSIEQRKALLAGILDCDSHFNARSNHVARPRYGTTSRQLMNDVMHLIRGLGGVAEECSADKRSENACYYSLIWTPFNPYTLDRMAEMYNPNYKHMRAIESVERLEDQEMMCISVAAEDSLYLVEDFVPTHNTWFAIKLAINAWLGGNSVMFINLEMSPEELRDRILFLISQYSMSDLIRAEIDPDDFRRWSTEFMDGKADFTLIGNEGFGAFTTSMVQAKIDQYKPSLVICDYMQLFSDSQMSGSEIERAKRTAREFKQLATATNVPVMVISAVTGKDKKDRLNPPDIAQVAWSSEIEYAANLAFAVHTHRDDEGNPINTEIVCRKNRHGPLFDFYVKMDLDNGTIEEVDLEEQVQWMEGQNFDYLEDE